MIEAPLLPDTLLADSSQPNAKERLKELYFNWSNERFSPLLENYQNKFRKDWFASVLGNLEIGRKKGLFDPALGPQILQVVSYFTRHYFRHEPYIDLEDVAEIDTVLATIFEDEKVLSSYQ